MSNRRRRDLRLAHPRPIRLTKRDLDIVETVHYYRVLKQDQLQALFFGSRATAQLRLQKLYDHGYLERKFLPVALGRGRSPTMYVLARRGAALLRAERGYDTISYQATGRISSSPFIEHTLLINDVFVAVYQACRSNGFVLEQWRGEGQIRRDYDRVVLGDEVSALGTPILPDSYFSVIAKKRQHHFFLEVDRGTMPASRFKTKVQAYVAYHRGGGYERRYGTRSLRVLTVVPSKVRLQRLLRVTAEAGGGSQFWFTTEEHVIGERLLTDPVWSIANAELRRVLIEKQHL